MISRYLLALLFACSSSKDAPKAFTFTEVKPGIYHAVATGKVVAICNAAIIVNKDDVMIVDSHISPESGRAMLQELKAITDSYKRVTTQVRTTG